MVDHSDICVCYCTSGEGGTAYTVRYAEKKEIPIVNLAGVGWKEKIPLTASGEESDYFYCDAGIADATSFSLLDAKRTTTFFNSASNTIQNAIGINRTVEELIRDRDISKVISLLQNRDEEVN